MRRIGNLEGNLELGEKGRHETNSLELDFFFSSTVFKKRKIIKLLGVGGSRPIEVGRGRKCTSVKKIKINKNFLLHICEDNTRVK